jgi:hypothetical protein
MGQAVRRTAKRTWYAKIPWPTLLVSTLFPDLRRSYPEGMLRRVLFLSLFFGGVACSSNPEESELAEPLRGAGVIFVSEPTQEAQFPAPEPSVRGLTIGGQLVFRRGGDRIARFQIEQNPELGFLRLIDADTGMESIHTWELAEVGRNSPNGEISVLRYLPADPWLHFPLWVGKQWTAEFASHSPRRPPIMLQVEYHCDGREMVTTPAGVFDCLRIWRAAGLAEEGSELRRTSLYWYSPEIGFIVRRLDDSELLELEAVLSPEQLAAEAARAATEAGEAEAAGSEPGEAGA